MVSTGRVLEKCRYVVESGFEGGETRMLVGKSDNIKVVCNLMRVKPVANNANLSLIFLRTELLFLCKKKKKKKKNV